MNKCLIFFILLHTLACQRTRDGSKHYSQDSSALQGLDETVPRVDTMIVKLKFDYTIVKPKVSRKDSFGTIWEEKSNDSYRFVASESNGLIVYKNKELFKRYPEIVAVERRWMNNKPKVSIRNPSGETIADIEYSERGILSGDIGEIRFSIGSTFLLGEFRNDPLIK